MAAFDYDHCTNGLTTTSNTTNNIWVEWQCDSTTATSDLYYPQWYRWTTATSDTITLNPHGVATVHQGIMQPRPMVRTIPAVAVDHEERRKRELAREAAKELAAKLLTEHLTPQQRKMLEQTKRFHVIGSDGKRYEVDCTRRHGNVYEMDELERRIAEYCIYQTGDTPLDDSLLAQKLLLQADASEFRRIANRRGLVAGA